eukprot:Skav203563  [mRNA]  locus=scaffold3576:166415:166753:- [translate_table: standard]
MQSIVASWPVDHAASVPNLIALLKQCKIKDILHIWVNGVDLSTLFWQLVQDSHQHKDLVTLTTAVQETLAATEPERNMLIVTCASSAPDHTLGVDGRHQHRVLNGSEGANER